MTMTLNIAIVLITLLVSFILMAMEVTTPNAVILCALAFLMFVGILSPTDALSGFANDGLATIALMYIIAYASPKVILLPTYLTGFSAMVTAKSVPYYGC